MASASEKVSGLFRLSHDSSSEQRNRLGLDIDFPPSRLNRDNDDVVDWTDVVIAKSNVFLIYTSFANAGLFLPTEVYVFPRFRNSFDYLNWMQTSAWKFNDVRLLYPALLFYETANRRAKDLP